MGGKPHAHSPLNLISPGLLHEAFQKFDGLQYERIDFCLSFAGCYPVVIVCYTAVETAVCPLQDLVFKYVLRFSEQTVGHHPKRGVYVVRHPGN